MVISVPLFFFQAWIWDEAMFVHINMKVLGALFYQSFVTASFGFMAWTRMLQKHAATALHSFLFIMPISGVDLGGLLLDEPITSKIILALILIAMGIVTLHLKTKIGIPFFHLQKHL